MSRRSFGLVAVGVTGLALGAILGQSALHSQMLRPWMPSLAQDSAKPEKSAGNDGHGHGAEGVEREEGQIHLTEEQVRNAKIDVAAVRPGDLVRRLTVPGTITADANRVARVAAKVVGSVSDLRKRLGENVEKGETIAVIDSREVAEAKSEFVSSQVAFDLQKTLFEREQSLFQKNISAEQQFLRARQTFTEAQLRADLARQKLIALNLVEQDIVSLTRQSAGLQRYDIRAPISGRIVERLVDLGAPVGGEGQAKELYVIADLTSIWIELAVSANDLPQIEEGQEVTFSAGPSGKSSTGRVAFVSPVLNQETRSARVIAEASNQNHVWRPGSYVTAQIGLEQKPVAIRVPKAAVQTIGGEKVVFVRNEEGFEKRDVVLGDADAEFVEILFGVDPDEKIAVSNSFVLKAELGKSEAEHAH